MYNVSSGDTFDDNKFYRNGIEIKKNFTAVERNVFLGKVTTGDDIKIIELGQLCTDLDIRLRALED